MELDHDEVEEFQSEDMPDIPLRIRNSVSLAGSASAPALGAIPSTPGVTAPTSVEVAASGLPEIDVQYAQLTYFDLRRRYLSQSWQTPLALTPEQKLTADFQRVKISGEGEEPQLRETIESLNKIREAIHLRNLYIDDTFHPIKKETLKPEPTKEDFFKDEYPPASKHKFEMRNGVVHCWLEEGKKEVPIVEVRTADQFFEDLTWIISVVVHGPCKTLAFQRLQLLESRFLIHKSLNGELEHHQQKAVPHRDFYNIRKIDNHVHHSAAMNQKHMLRFIKKKLKTEPDVVVIHRDGKELTLKEVFDSLNLEPYDLSVDALNMHAHGAFQRFDKFNLKYNPIGETRLREIFLKTDNLIKGRYLAEITHEVFVDLEANKYQFAEYRLSIYGKKRDEWDRLADWICNFELYCPNVRWMIQIPRLYSVYKSQKLVSNFQEMIDNIFLPLFEVSVNPSSHKSLHKFLRQVVGFDSVDDESLRENQIYVKMPTPAEWDIDLNPPYAMWSYYLYANLKVLNALRESNGLNTFAFRPHAGEAGDFDHLACSFLLAKSIAHGVLLKKSPVLQYLFFLTQIGISISPLSNNLLFVNYSKNPFPVFFARGLNVTLSTDDPLMIHYTKEPLVEEYSVAAQVWKLNPTDLSEIARNSVLQSGFEDSLKAHWIGSDYLTRGPLGNDTRCSNVPSIRIAFRHEQRDAELNFVFYRKKGAEKEEKFKFKM